MDRAREEAAEERVPHLAGPAARGDAAVLDAWLTESGEQVVAALREAGPDTEVWAWAGICSTGFWARRMTHEITVPRADAMLAAGLPYEIAPVSPPTRSASGSGSWSTCSGRSRTTRRAHCAALPAASTCLPATDTEAGLDAEWPAELTEGGVTWCRGHEKAAVALRGPLTAVVLAFCRRLPLEAPELEVLGDRRLPEFWLERATFGWGGTWPVP